MECMDLVGYENREFLKNSLALVLAKNPEEKEAFEDCFERFFVMDKPAQPGNTSSSEDESGGEDEFDDGDFNAEGESQQSGKGGGQGGGQGAGEQEIDDSVPQLQPTSELGKLLTTGTRTEQTISMMEAGRKVEVSKIVVFTPKRPIYPARLWMQWASKVYRMKFPT